MRNAHETMKSYLAAKTRENKTRLQRQINLTEKQIDQQVYELYRLTEEETRVVESNS